MRLSGSLRALLAVALLATAGAGRAQDAQLWRVLPDRVATEVRPFAFVSDPSTPAAGVTAVGETVALGSGASAERPIPIHLGSAGLANELTLSHGVTDRIAPFVTAIVAQDRGATVETGARLQVTPRGAPLEVTLVAAGMREGESGHGGAMVRAVAGWIYGPVSVVANFHAEKVFAPGRDGMDVFALAGASMKVVGGLRLGAEYVAQDLESLGDPSEAEGGVRQGVGPSVALALDRGHWLINAAGLLGLGPRSPTVLFRAGITAAF